MAILSFNVTNRSQLFQLGTSPTAGTPGWPLTLMLENTGSQPAWFAFATRVDPATASIIQPGQCVQVQNAQNMSQIALMVHSAGRATVTAEWGDPTTTIPLTTVVGV
jgi:hypothetical protein